MWQEMQTSNLVTKNNFECSDESEESCSTTIRSAHILCDAAVMRPQHEISHELCSHTLVTDAAAKIQWLI